MRIRRSDLVRALGRSKEVELDGVHDLLVGLSAGRGPQKKDIKDVSPFFSSVLQRVPFFYTKQVNDEGGGKPSMFGRNLKTLSGVLALQAHRAEISSLFADGLDRAVSMGHLMPLKTYGCHAIHGKHI
jgi:hypothetical protein